MDNNVLKRRGFSLAELSLVLMLAGVFIAAAFYSAAKYVNKKAASVFFVTDIVKSKPFYKNLDAKDMKAIEAAICRIASSVKQFAAKMK